MSCWNCFEGSVGEASDRRGGAFMGFPERIDIVLNWTELNSCHTGAWYHRWYYMRQVIPQIIWAANHDVTRVCVVPQILCATNHDVTHARQIMTSGMCLLPQMMMSCAAIIRITRTVLVLLSFLSPWIKWESFPWEIWTLFAALQKIGIQLQSSYLPPCDTDIISTWKARKKIGG